MGKIAVSAKAGTIAGVVRAALGAAFLVVLLSAFKGTILSQIRSSLPSGTSFNATSEYNLVVAAVVIVAIAGAIILDFILGMVFGAISERLPGRTYLLKGLFFGLVMWLILSVLGGLSNLVYGTIFYGTEIGAGLAFGLLSGALLGILFDRGMKKHNVPHSQSSAQ